MNLKSIAPAEPTDPDNPLSHLVSAYGTGIRGPLMQSNDVRLIQIRDSEGKVEAMFIRLTNSKWGFVHRGDPDWEDNRRRLEIDDSEYLS